ncbi:MAG TPA: L-threonylcarbamoyladenylate synthase [Edaphobacter sp.]|jgi:L-threonylcarbamoyladenylate synthase|nr:L-threonylcarbamoyladenylate synthase [Edaphobacter sp.]
MCDPRDFASRNTERLSNTSEDIARAAEILRNGGLVAFPTETVYGLGANALNADAVARIFTAKERPSWDPVIVHVSDRAMLYRVAIVPPEAERLIAAFWPGPLTLLLPRTPQVPDSVTAGRALVGVRMPAHPIALALIEAAGLPIAAPSANRFGRTSPTTAQHVLDDLDHRIDAILDAGPTTVGVESTVLDPAAGLIYRPGAITAAMLEPVIGSIAGPVTLYQPQSAAEPQSLPSPGTGIRHYAPRATLILVPSESELNNRLTHLLAEKEKPGVMLPQNWTIHHRHVEVFHWNSFDDNAALAQTLFAGLRELDRRNVTVILCPLPAHEGLGLAIRDRLEKAAKSKPESK